MAPPTLKPDRLSYLLDATDPERSCLGRVSEGYPWRLLELGEAFSLGKTPMEVEASDPPTLKMR